MALVEREATPEPGGQSAQRWRVLSTGKLLSARLDRGNGLTLPQSGIRRIAWISLPSASFLLNRHEDIATAVEETCHQGRPEPDESRTLN
jgi:hypothetical protein